MFFPKTPRERYLVIALGLFGCIGLVALIAVAIWVIFIRWVFA